MKKLTLLLASLAISAAATAADAPRLALWVTTPIGATSGVQCHLPPTATSNLLATQPTLSEHDVTAWNKGNARWALNPTRFIGDTSRQKLQDHCFVLAIDGKLIRSGIILSSHSARLTRFPTISVYNQNNTLSLQLTSGNHGSDSRPIHVDVLDNVFSQHIKPTNSTKMLQETAEKLNPAKANAI
ncbi:MAG: hypothetical protein ACXW11_08930 [Methylotenera sp.]